MGDGAVVVDQVQVACTVSEWPCQCPPFYSLSETVANYMPVLVTCCHVCRWFTS
jgi:hypothetical protein